MEELSGQEKDELLVQAPGGIAKLAFDDMLTILYMSESFYSLIKNVADKLSSKIAPVLLKMVYSADIIYVTQQIAAQKHRKDNLLQFQFRTLQQDGSFKWVMISGSKTGEVYQSGSKSVPVYSCIAMDATNLMVNHKKLEQTLDYRNKIMELSKDLYFEYEIATDTLSFNELFREIFGKDANFKGFRNRLENTKMIHSDQLPAVISIYNSMMRGRKQARFELNLKTKDGSSCWYICYASIIFDENRNPYKVVGKLSTINHTEGESEKSIYQPQVEALTNVFTMESAEYLISETVKRQEEDTLGALFIIDVRNYKKINEIRKVTNDEDILKSIASLLKMQFRASDIIGKLGHGEFTVYMKNVPSDYTVYEKAEMICKAIEQKHSFSYSKNRLSVSIGVAFQRGSKDYQMLISNANTALVAARKVPTSSFEVFSQEV